MKNYCSRLFSVASFCNLPKPLIHRQSGTWVVEGSWMSSLNWTLRPTDQEGFGTAPPSSHFKISSRAAWLIGRGKLDFYLTSCGFLLCHSWLCTSAKNVTTQKATHGQHAIGLGCVCFLLPDRWLSECWMFPSPPIQWHTSNKTIFTAVAGIKF